MRPADLLGHGEHVGRSIEAIAGPGARERLEAEHAPVLQVPDRLEGDLDPRFVEQRSQSLDLRGRHDRDQLRDIVEDHDFPARALALVERRIGLLPENGRIGFGRGLQHGDADRERALRRAFSRRREASLDADARLAAVRPRQKHRELVAADPERAVVRTAALEDSSHLHQHLVALCDGRAGRS